MGNYTTQMEKQGEAVSNVEAKVKGKVYQMQCPLHKDIKYWDSPNNFKHRSYHPNKHMSNLGPFSNYRHIFKFNFCTHLQFQKKDG